MRAHIKVVVFVKMQVFYVLILQLLFLSLLVVNRTNISTSAGLN